MLHSSWEVEVELSKRNWSLTFHYWQLIIDRWLYTYYLLLTIGQTPAEQLHVHKESLRRTGTIAALQDIRAGHFIHSCLRWPWLVFVHFLSPLNCFFFIHQDQTAEGCAAVVELSPPLSLHTTSPRHLRILRHTRFQRRTVNSTYTSRPALKAEKPIKTKNSILFDRNFLWDEA